jgi:phospholipase/carboxylesterase
VADDPQALPHLLREPAGEPEGALILNHGRGTTEHDLFPLLDLIDPRRRLLGIAPGGPLTGVPPGGRHWYLVPRVGYPDPDTFHRSYTLLTAFCDGTLAERGIGWDRAVIGGFSMGAVMSYAVALGRGRPSPAAVLALSGFVPTVEGWSADLEGRAGLPVFIHHGRTDPIISIEFGRRARDLLESGGLDLTYIETDAGHELPPAVASQLPGFVAGTLGITDSADPGGGR